MVNNVLQSICFNVCVFLCLTYRYRVEQLWSMICTFGYDLFMVSNKKPLHLTALCLTSSFPIKWRKFTYTDIVLFITFSQYFLLCLVYLNTVLHTTIWPRWPVHPSCQRSPATTSVLRMSLTASSHESAAWDHRTRMSTTSCSIPCGETFPPQMGPESLTLVWIVYAKYGAPPTELALYQEMHMPLHNIFVNVLEIFGSYHSSMLNKTWNVFRNVFHLTIYMYTWKPRITVYINVTCQCTLKQSRSV